MELDQIKTAIEKLRQGASEFFEIANQNINEAGGGGSLNVIHPYPSDLYWSLIEDNTQKLSSQLQGEMFSIVGSLTDLVKSSMLLNEADERDLGISTKAMRAFLRLRMYRSWDSEVLHDEGYVLGVKPAGQSENEPLFPNEAKREFFMYLDRVSQLLEILEVSPINLLSGHSLSNPISSSSYRQNTAFIMMHIDQKIPELNDLYDVYKECFQSFGIKAIRADDIEHNDIITNRILEEIKTSEFLLSDLTNERPSVYYEVGYAHSLGKRVILFRKSGTKIHFDLAAYNCPEYDNYRDLREKLNKRLMFLTNKMVKNI